MWTILSQWTSFPKHMFRHRNQGKLSINIWDRVLYLFSLSVLNTTQKKMILYVDSALNGCRQTILEWWEWRYPWWWMMKGTEPGLGILQSCSVLAFHKVKDVEFESLTAVWASVFAHKIIHAQLVVSCINATAVFGDKGPAFTYFTFNLLRLEQKNNICFFL